MTTTATLSVLDRLQERGLAPTDVGHAPAARGRRSPAGEQIAASLGREPSVPRSPLVIAGVGEPGYLGAVWQGVRDADPDGLFRRRLVVVHEDLGTLARALEVEGPQELADDPAVEWFLGPDAVERFSSWLEGRRCEKAPDRLIAAQDEQSVKLARRIQPVLASLLETQKAEAARLESAVRSRYGGRSRLDARARLCAGVRGDRPLTIAVAASRHTSYVHASATDLARSLEHLGHRVVMIEEPDGSSLLTRLGYLGVFAENDVDLAVAVNYTRTNLRGCFPDELPVATWVQDAMPHLYDPAVGEGQTLVDVLVGSVTPELSESLGYNSGYLLPRSMPASEHKFHSGPVAEAEGPGCEIAFVSHHSQTPELLRESLAAGLAGLPNASHAMDSLWESAQEIAGSAGRVSLHDRLNEHAARAFRHAAGREPAVAETARLRHSVLAPLVGRLFRHEAIGWAAEIAERRGWAFSLFGRGWEDHPAYARYAAGPLGHGEPLRAAYQGAAVHLHLDPVALTHQRVFECVFSGGLPVARLHADALAPSWERAIDELLEASRPLRTDPDGTRVFAADATPMTTRLTEQERRLGFPPRREIRVPAGRDSYGAHYRNVIAKCFDAVALFDGLDDVCFSSPDQLESVLERAIDDRDWRDARSERMAAAMRPVVSTTAFARDVLEFSARAVGYFDHLMETTGSFDCEPGQWLAMLSEPV